MRTVARSICVAAALALGLSLTVSTAVAKGPTDLTIYGPGVDVYVDLASRRRTDIDTQALTAAALLYRHWDGSGLGQAPPLTPDQLGPRYVLSWTVGSSAWAVQHAYPFAEGGAWVQFLPEVTGGWTKAPGLKKQLIALGAVEEQPAATVAPAPPETAPRESTTSEQDSLPSYDVAVWTGVALAVVLGAGVLILWRRRPSRLSR